jgi:hypothetical protein
MTMITNAENLVRRAYHAAEGNVMDVQGFIELFADDGVFNAVGQASFRGEHLGDPVVSMAKLAKIKQFDCYVSSSIMLEQIGIGPDFASAVARSHRSTS